MKRLNKVVIVALAAVMGMSAPLTAHALGPEFARTPEEWSHLRDNVLEYAEIADLIHEYNVTVQNNQYELNEFKKKYGKTKDDIVKSYRDLADELEENISGDDSAMAMVSDMQLELQAKQLRQQADDNLEDSHIYYLSYAQTEDNLVLSAQAKFISYYRSQLELESAKEQKQILENAHAAAVTQQRAGIVTEVAVLSAKEAILEQEKTITRLEQEIENTRQSLIIMLGWKGSDQPEIREIPQVKMDEMMALDLNADKQTALKNNYTLRINQRKLENAEDADNKQNIQRTIQGNERQIGVSVTNAWNSLQSAKLSYEQTVADAETAERDMELTGQKWNAGIITKYAYEQQQVTLSAKKRAVETASLSLLEALETYRWNVNGLANAG